MSGVGRNGQEWARPSAAAAAWAGFHKWAGPPSQEAVYRALRLAGVKELSTHPTDHGYGILLFDAIDGDLEQSVRALSRSGNCRIIAVARTQAVLLDRPTWRLLAAGAADVLAWDQSADPASRLAARLARWRAVDELVESPLVRDTLVGDSPEWRSRLCEIVEAAHFTDAPVLITGETGTGKELVARLIHALDSRPAKGEFVVVDCTTVVPTLSGSEFFGHEKGAFTGAVSARDGAFALADQGTLFLDEIGDLPLPLQAELLRVIQEGMYKRVGSNAWRHTTFRLVSATNRDLVQEGSAGRFRRDLYYRITGWEFHMPSLRHRRADIPQLARHFLATSRPELANFAWDPSVDALLRRREYPGNVRDLRQLVSRIAARHVGPAPITVGDVPPEDRPPELAPPADDHFDAAVRAALARGLTLREIGQQATDTAVRIACADEHWNLQRAAHRLGVTDRALQMRRAANRPVQAAGADRPPT